MHKMTIPGSLLALMTVLSGQLAGLSFAGTISGGGGELRRYEGNPWFVKNTFLVTYCIEHDPNTFDIDPQVAADHIRGALTYWKSYFRTWERRMGDQPFRVGTQTFIQRDTCAEDTDIRFQLGTLLADQRRELHDPSRWVGVAVMSEYDKVNMRARGYIYFGANRGPDRMRSSAERPVHASPWTVCSGLVLRIVALHEIGHIFGLPHIDESNILRAETPAGAVSHASVDYLLANPQECEFQRRIFEQDDFYVKNLIVSKPLMLFDLDVNNGPIRATVFRIQDGWEKIILRDENGGRYELTGAYGSRRTISIELPAEQEVFPPGYYAGYDQIVGGDWLGTYNLEGVTMSTVAYSQNRALHLARYNGERSAHERFVAIQDLSSSNSTKRELKFSQGIKYGKGKAFNRRHGH